MSQHRQCPRCRFDVGAEDSACPFCDTVLVPMLPPLATPKPRGRRPGLVACPDCGATVSARAESCPGCGCPLQTGRRRPAGRIGRTLVRSLIGGLALLVLLNMLTAGRRSAKAPLNPPRVAPGDRGVLARRGGDGAYVAFGAEAWRRMIQAQGGRDIEQMHKLEGTGRIAHIVNGTPVQVVGSHTIVLQLRLLAGPHADREGWTRKEFVRPVP